MITFYKDAVGIKVMIPVAQCYKIYVKSKYL